MLLNLYSNAIKFTDRNGLIVIIIEKTKSMLSGLTINEEKGDKILISVSDSGIGIEEANQNKLFKLFGSIKDKKKKINT